jgi:hypothetical protein
MGIKWSDAKVAPVDIKTNDVDEKVVNQVLNWRDDAEEETGTWLNSQEKWHKLRMRIKKEKTFPFIGCANLRMPTIETKIRKLKASLLNVLFGLRPIVQVIPAPSGNWEVAKKIEMFIDHLAMNVMQIKDKVLIAIDQAIEKGFYLVKPYWRVQIDTRCEELSLDELSIQEAMWFFDTLRTPEELYHTVAQRFNVDMSPRVMNENKVAVEEAVNQILAGKDEIKMYVKDVIYDFPDVALCPPERIYVPPASGYNPQECQYVIHEFLLPIDVVKSNVELKNWNKFSVDEIDLAKNIDLEDKSLDITKDTREGVSRLKTNNLVRILECYCYYDINNDGQKEKCIITVAKDFGKLLRKIVIPFFSCKFPFVKFFYELTDDRWFSHRGIPEMIEDIVKEIDMQHMQKLDYQTMANSPLFLYRAGQVGKNTQQFLFGQGLPVHGMQPLNDVFAPINKANPNIEFSYKDEQMILESKVEELTGQVDFSLQSMINRRQPRTLGEVEMQQQNMQNVFGMDADLFRGSFEELINWVYDLWCQYGDDNYEFMYFGIDNPQGSLVKISKEELQGKYKIVIRGNDSNTNPNVRLQKAQQMMLSLQNPLLLQTGIVTPINIFNIMKRFYQELNIPNWEELISQPQPPQPPMPEINLQGMDLTDGEVAQVLAKQGIQPDVQGRMMKKQEELKDKEFEKLAEVANVIKSNEPKRPSQER